MTGLKALTSRGRSFLAAGVAALACAIVLGEQDLVRIAVLVLALPLLAALVVARTRYRLTCARRLEPARVEAGTTSTVMIRLSNATRLPTGLLLVEDTLPSALEAAPRYALDRVEPHGVREIRYTVRPAVRGRYPIGPLTVRITDPFGLVELVRSFTFVDTLTVTPRIEPLPRVRLSGEWGDGGEGRTRSIATAGDDDVAPREYRHGDELRRVHWRSTARRGELMVRREEQQWESRGTLLLDTRRWAHRGDGAASSFEAAVSAAASIGAALAQDGLTLRLVTDEGRRRPAEAGAWPLLDMLAVVRESPLYSLEQGIAALRQDGDGLIIAVLGALHPEDARALAGLRRHGVNAVAVLLDVATWGGHPDETAGQARALLTGAGWRVLDLAKDTPLAAVWPQAGRRRAA